MFTLFISGFVLLVSLFAVKLVEVKTGRILFFSRFRQRADQFVLSWWHRLRSYQQHLLARSKQLAVGQVKTLRHRLAVWLKRLSDHLRE